MHFFFLLKKQIEATMFISVKMVSRKIGMGSYRISC